MRLIPLTRGLFATVDDEDYERLSVFRWHAKVQVRRGERVYYAVRTASVDGVKRTIRMHREVVGANALHDVDHIKAGLTLDNRKHNLRVASSVQNSRNRLKTPGKSSRYKGVSRRRDVFSKPWHSQITVGPRRIHIGFFSTEEDAATAYNFLAAEHFGEFALFNA